MKNIERESDAGLGLLELVIATMVTAVLLIGIASVFAGSWRTQEEVMSVSAATTRGQLLGAAIERAVRNAVYLQVSDGGTVLRVSTSLTGALKCQGFRFTDVPPGQALFVTSATTLGDSSVWPSWNAGVQASSGADFFAEPSPGVVRYQFEISTDSAPVRIHGEVRPRSAQAGSSDSCWP